MSTVVPLHRGSGVATVRVSDMERVRVEAKTILRRSGPPPGKYWFTGLLGQASINLQRRRMWERRTAA